MSLNLNGSSRRAEALPLPALGLLQVLSKYLLNDFISGRLSGEMCVKLGPEDEKELLVRRGGVRGPGRGNSRCGDSEAGKRNREQPEVTEPG